MTNLWKRNLKRVKTFGGQWDREWERERVYNFSKDTQHPNCLLETLNVVFDSLKGAAKLRVAIGFELKNVEDGSCRFSYAHEKSTLLREI